MIDRMQQHFGFATMPFGRDLAPATLHRHASHTQAAARITWTVTDIGNPRYQNCLNTQPASWWEQGTRTLAGDRAAFWPARRARSGSPA
jgi:hypothetical protein